MLLQNVEDVDKVIGGKPIILGIFIVVIRKKIDGVLVSLLKFGKELPYIYHIMVCLELVN